MLEGKSDKQPMGLVCGQEMGGTCIRDMKAPLRPAVLAVSLQPQFPQQPSSYCEPLGVLLTSWATFLSDFPWEWNLQVQDTNPQVMFGHYGP